MNAVLALIVALIPAGTNAALIEKIIEALIALYPIIVQEYKDLVPIVKNIIVALRSDPSTTTAQLDALDTMEAQIDGDFDAASTAAQAEDGTSST